MPVPIPQRTPSAGGEVIGLLEAAAACFRRRGWQHDPTSSRYSLAGVKAATTGPHEAFIARARQVLKADERILAAYLGGASGPA